uniref:Uncharacterized protein n=1 Tax=Anguilla anguilla TaxID=7936 RepID=A0A0E9SZ70_ANGAN
MFQPLVCVHTVHLKYDSASVCLYAVDLLCRIEFESLCEVIFIKIALMLKLLIETIFPFEEKHFPSLSFFCCCIFPL